MVKYFYFNLLVVIVAIAGCASVHEVYPIKHAPKDSVVYTLPKNLVEVKVPIKRISESPGKYKDFSEKLIGIKPIENESTKYSVSNSIEIGTVAIPDPDAVFGVKVNHGPLKDAELVMKLNEMGFMTEGKSVVTDKTVDLVTQTLKVGAGIVGKVMTFGATKSLNEIAVSYAKTKNLDLNLAQEAAKLMDKLEGVRNARAEFLTLNVQGQNLQLDVIEKILEEYEKEEDKILSQFVGTKTESTWTAVFEIEPGFGPQGKDLLILNSEKGIKLKHSTRNESKFLMDDAAENVCVNITEQTLACEDVPTARNKYLKNIESADTNKDRASGFYYRIPGWAEYTVRMITIKNDKKQITEMAKKEVSIAQFGKIRTLPKSTGSWNGGTYYLNLHEDSGAIKEITVTGTALTLEQIEAVGTASDAVLDVVDPIKELDDKIELIKKQKELDELLNPLPAEEE